MISLKWINFCVIHYTVSVMISFHYFGIQLELSDYDTKGSKTELLQFIHLRATL